MTASPFILAISTSSGVARVAASTRLESGLQRPQFDFEITDYKSQSALLLPMIQQHLSSSGLQPSDAVAIAVDIGPGGFTSLRTACGVAQGLAIAWKVPTIPLSSFECMLPPSLAEQLITVLIDARLNEVYCATLSRQDGETQWHASPSLMSREGLLNIRGPAVCDKAVYSLMDNPPVEFTQVDVSAILLAQAAWQEFTAGRLRHAIDCQPLYVRDKVAQTTSERLALKHGT